MSNLSDTETKNLDDAGMWVNNMHNWKCCTNSMNERKTGEWDRWRGRRDRASEKV